MEVPSLLRLWRLLPRLLLGQQLGLLKRLLLGLPLGLLLELMLKLPLGRGKTSNQSRL